MDVYVARQPILNKKQDVFGYELLYRSNNEQNMAMIDGDQATSEVIINGFFHIGYEELTEGKLCFINFTENLLKNEIPTFTNPEKVVIEILETVVLTKEIVDICKKLKAAGYKIALDDFILLEGNQFLHEILQIIDIVKVDIRNTSRAKQLQILHFLNKYNVVLLAEKVETREEYEQCLEDGYDYFQGYFFSKPVILTGQDVPFYNPVIMNVLHELSKREPDVDKVAQSIEHDVSLSYKLLKLINSPAFRTKSNIKSIKQAIVLLGLEEVKKWLFFLAVRESNKQHVPTEVIKMSFCRAKECELIAQMIGNQTEQSSYFLIGMFSLIESLLNSPMEKIVSQLPLDEEMKAALLGVQNKYKKVLDIVVSIEQAKWSEVDRLAVKLGLSPKTLFDIHSKSIVWTKDVFLEL
ncbi:HDOD domain-containing protein [Alkalihalobacillus sp. LMS39]|uniref:EAL and HDOD domain-containing protein n=1 Tax=Alkalihalobacillus sp. LMS39 TaxID=2924032 RepID=UPI001FB265E2|nr:HDOD domain-containing protein [Alkalihalobacillus sp. LMS39]UOE94035.1 HDOD domain-containing protein [Alkalihalobacillus sp. LMS39]